MFLRVSIRYFWRSSLLRASRGVLRRGSRKKKNLRLILRGEIGRGWIRRKLIWRRS